MSTRCTASHIYIRVLTNYWKIKLLSLKIDRAKATMDIKRGFQNTSEIFLHLSWMSTNKIGGLCNICRYKRKWSSKKVKVSIWMPSPRIRWGFYAERFLIFHQTKAGSYLESGKCCFVIMGVFFSRESTCWGPSFKFELTPLDADYL